MACVRLASVSRTEVLMYSRGSKFRVVTCHIAANELRQFWEMESQKLKRRE